jgi:hypothetical protein
VNELVLDRVERLRRGSGRKGRSNSKGAPRIVKGRRVRGCWERGGSNEGRLVTERFDDFSVFSARFWPLK